METLEALAVQTRKVETYGRFAEFFIKFTGTSSQKKSDFKKLGLELQRQGLILMIVASDDVVEKYLEWRALSMGGKDSDSIVGAYADIIIAMRKDLNPETTCTVEHVLDAMG